jgi:hypothetical protein
LVSTPGRWSSGEVTWRSLVAPIAHRAVVTTVVDDGATGCGNVTGSFRAQIRVPVAVPCAGRVGEESPLAPGAPRDFPPTWPGGGACARWAPAVRVVFSASGQRIALGAGRAARLSAHWPGGGACARWAPEVRVVFSASGRGIALCGWRAARLSAHWPGGGACARRAPGSAPGVLAEWAKNRPLRLARRGTFHPLAGSTRARTTRPKILLDSREAGRGVSWPKCKFGHWFRGREDRLADEGEQDRGAACSSRRHCCSR